MNNLKVFALYLFLFAVCSYVKETNEKMLKEARLLAKLQHKYIIKLFGVCKGAIAQTLQPSKPGKLPAGTGRLEVISDAHSLLIVMEFAPMNSMRDFLQLYTHQTVAIVYA